MMPNDDQLRLAYRAAEPRALAGAHPEPEALLAVVERSGDEGSRLGTLDHVLACAVCRRDLDLIRASVAAAGGVRSPRRWLRSPAIRLMALAATMLVVAGIALFRSPSGSGLDGDRVLRGTGGVAVYPVQPVSRIGAGLAWRPVVGADHYRLEVVDETGVAVVDSTLRDTVAVVTNGVLRGRPGLTWSVTAVMTDGGERSSLPQRLEPPSR